MSGSRVRLSAPLIELAAASCLAGLSLVAAGEAHAGTGDVTICHATGEYLLPYIVSSASPATVYNSHYLLHTGGVWFDGAASWGDIIPPFEFNGQIYSLNWPSGQAFYQDACSVESADSTPPTITPTVVPSTPNGDHGWYTSSPKVSFTVYDPGSPITNQTGCAQQVVSTDTAAVTFTCQATSTGGTNSVGVTIRRDATEPVLEPTITPKPVLLHGPVTAKAHASDATSGISDHHCTLPSTAKAGARSVVCSATDRAGNSTQKTVPYTVQYVMTPLTVTGAWQAGHDVTIAMKLTDAAGKPIADQQAAALDCRVTLSITGAQRHLGCLAYHRATNRFSIAVHLGARTGPATVKVSVSYPLSAVHTTRTKAVTVTAA